MTIMQNVGKWLLVGALLGSSLAFAQSEPTLSQIYQSAQSGQLEQAQVMMQQVLVAHPGSGKAHFVQAELFARQGKLAPARESLTLAEKLTPGLPFAKPESVQALRSQLTAKASVAPLSGSAQHRGNASATSPATPESSFPWGLGLALGGGAIALVIFLSRRKAAPAYDAPPAYAGQAAMQGGLNGPQGFGMANTVGSGGVMQAPYGQPAYGQPSYGQPQGSGLGGKIMGGVATGLAVGAGVMAAQAIGRSLSGHRDEGARASDSLANNDLQNVDRNPDMGGQNFGVNDADSWDDGGGANVGGDWEN
jgi:hypothetical protein